MAKNQDTSTLLSVVILNYNVSCFLYACVQSVQRAVKGINAKIIVIDNHSSDSSCEMIKTHFPQVILIENQKNMGFSKGNNLGVNQISGKFVCILNPDTMVSETLFHNVLDTYAQLSNPGIVGCRLVDGQGRFLPESKRKIPTPLGSLKKLLGFGNDYYQNDLGETQNGKIEILVGAFMLMETKLYKLLHGFDESFFMYGEDIDLSYRSLKLGYNNYYIGSETCIHFKGESTLENRAYKKRFYNAMSIFHTKHFKHKIILNSLVKLGIHFFYFIKRKQKNKVIFHPQRQIVCTHKKESALKDSIFRNFEKISLSEFKIQESSTVEVVLDAESYSYDEIIQFIIAHRAFNQVYFKIWPAKASFYVGSFHSDSLGNVTHIAV